VADAVADHDRVGAELLAEGHGHGVLVLGTAHLEDVGELARLGVEPALQLAQGGQRVAHGEDDAQLDGRGVGVVRRLRAVHVVVGMQELVLALAMPEPLEGPVGDHLVGVHVGRGAGSALDHVDDEVLVQLAGDDLVAGGDDRLRLPLVEHAELGVRLRRRLLHQREGAHEVLEAAQLDAGEGEVLHAAQRLHAVVDVIGQLALADQVVLASPGGDGGRSGFAQRAFAGGGEAGAQLARHIADGAVERLGPGAAQLVEGGARDLPDARALAGDGRGGVRQIVEHHTFAERRPGVDGGQVDAAAVQAADDLHLALLHDAEPQSRRGLVEQVVAGAVHMRLAALQERDELLGRDSHRRGEGGDPLARKVEGLDRWSSHDILL